MDILTWLIVGLVAGLLASMLVGGYVFRAAGWSAPWDGLAGTIFVAFIGAAICLAIIHLVRGATTRRTL